MTEQKGVDRAEELKQFFLKENKFTDHYNRQKNEAGLYKSVLMLLINQGVDLSVGTFLVEIFSFQQGTKARILAAAWARHDVVFADYLINGVKEQNLKAGKPDIQAYTFGLVEILKALNLLDSRF